MPTLGPRVVIAGTHSGVGKTTVATGLMAAFSAKGMRVASAKVGPDFIDPGYHSLATSRPGRSLDAWMSGEELLPGLAASAAESADLLVIEGVMGLFDGSAQPGCDGSTAAVAKILDAPVVLVVDASAMSGSVAAIVHGYRDFDRGLDLAGVILNRVGSEGHALLLREALEPLGIRVLGVMLHHDELVWRERHLGLVPVAEHPEQMRTVIARLGEVIAECCDLAGVAEVAKAAPKVFATTLPRAERVGSVRIALAQGPAFSFNYPENLDLLVQAGAELVPFDPLEDPTIPEGCDALVAGGGFPEVFAPALGANYPLLNNVRSALRDGLVTWAECGGLLWLCNSIDGIAMVGALPADARMTATLTLGYRSAVTRSRSPLGPAGIALRGHEFHCSALEPAGGALDLTGRFGDEQAGYVSSSLFASFLHQHLAARPEIVERFLASALANRRN